LEYLLKQADTTVENLKNVLINLAEAKQVGVDQIFLPPDIQNNIDILGKTTNISAMIPKLKTEQSSKQIQHLLHPV
jgi:CO dehydrogenase/acetyl-CoA synthase gamma subunit (corrinoid Fe-S protein)